MEKNKKTLTQLVNELHELVGQMQKQRIDPIRYLATYDNMGKELLCDKKIR